MKNIVLLLSVLFLSTSAKASNDEFDAKQFAKHYFNAWIATQSPHAKKSDIQHYLNFLKSNVGHQHLPYDPEDNRELNGKEKMLEGMLYYLGAHTKYAAKLKSVVAGYNVVVIKYSTQLTAKHPQTAELIELSYDSIEVLELEDGKVAIIRKYSE